MPNPYRKGIRLIFRSQKGGPGVAAFMRTTLRRVCRKVRELWGRECEGVSGVQAGGDAKPTFETLAVTPGRDLFSS